MIHDRTSGAEAPPVPITKHESTDYFFSSSLTSVNSASTTSSAVEVSA